MENPEGKGMLGRPGRSWGDSIELYLQAVGWYELGWINMVQDRPKGRALMNIVINFVFLKIQTIFRFILKR